MEMALFNRNLKGKKRNRGCGSNLNSRGADRSCHYFQVPTYRSCTDNLPEDYKRKRGNIVRIKGEVTAFLSLIFILLLSFSGAIMESASIQMAKNYRRADMNRAIESVFAEYQQELEEEFHIFALDASYESGEYSEDKIKNRLSYYGAENMENSVARIQLLTDRGGEGFQEQAAAYIEEKYGIASLEGLLGKTPAWKEQDEKSSDYQAEEEASEIHLEEMLTESEESLPGENNPLPNITNLKSSPLVNIVMPKDRAVSEKQVQSGSLLSRRELRRGYGTFTDVAEDTGISKLGMGEYVLEHFSTAVSAEDERAGNTLRGNKTPKGGALDYEMEYILAGKNSDKENLEAVVKKLLLLRFVPNYGYLQSDTAKRAEAEALALTLCTLLTVPAIAEAVTQALLFAWAFGECIMDVRALLKGNRVPLIKTGESWQLQMSELLTLGTEEDTKEGKDTEGGMKYEDYMRMLLFLEDTSGIAMRGLDMIEKRLQTAGGCEWFLADSCVSRMEIKSRCSFRRGITYEFQTYYGYR